MGVHPLPERVLDELDVVRLVVNPFVRDRLDAGRHVERAHLVAAGGERREGPDRLAFLGRLALVQIRVGRHPVDRVDHPIQADDL